MVQVKVKGYDALTDSYRSEGQVMVNELTKGKQHQVPLVVSRGFRVPRQHIVTDHSWTRELSATFTCLARYVVSLNYEIMYNVYLYESWLFMYLNFMEH